MLVVSKFRDFYDSMASQGVDKTLVYKRETADADFIRLPRHDLVVSEEHEIKSSLLRLRLVGAQQVIAFCGNIHVYWRGELQVNKDGGWVTDHLFYKPTKKELFAAMRAVYGLEEKKNRVRRYRFWWDGNKKRGSDAVTFDEAVRNIDWEAWHTSLKSPVLKLRETTQDDAAQLKKLPYIGYGDREQYFRVVKDPVLKDAGFERYVDPFTAWQEIAMYMGGVIGQPERPMYKLNDKELRDKRGFDNWSFKKRAEGK